MFSARKGCRGASGRILPHASTRSKKRRTNGEQQYSGTDYRGADGSCPGAVRIFLDSRRIVSGHCDDFCEVQRVTSRCLLDLLTATEAIRHDHRIRRCRADRRQQTPFAGGLRHFVVIALEAEGAGHSTAAGIDDPVIHAQAIQHVAIAFHPKEYLLMTMTVDQRSNAERLGAGLVRRSLGKGGQAIEMR